LDAKPLGEFESFETISRRTAIQTHSSIRPPFWLNPAAFPAETLTALFRCRLRLSRNVRQSDHILANPIIRHQAERRPGSSEIWLAVTKHDGVQVDSILIDQAKFGEASRQVLASNFVGSTVILKITTVRRPSCWRHTNGTSAIFRHSHDADARC